MIIKGDIKYKLIESDENLIGYAELIAIINYNSYNLISNEDELCIDSVITGDFNNNGYNDILIEIINGCGGNCCGNSYKIFSFNGKEFIGTEVVGWDWDGVEIFQPSSNGFSFRVNSNKEGYSNSSLCNNTIETYQLDNYSLKLINVVKDNMLNAIIELKTSFFVEQEGGETLLITFDIDDDGKLDSIIGSSEHTRWGEFSWDIKFGNGKIINGFEATKRIGVLNSKTNNVYDLVIGCEDVWKWNGVKYEFID